MGSEPDGSKETSFHLLDQEPVECEVVLDLLTSLVERSMVVSEERDGRIRYNLLETVRQYSGERLRQTDEHSRIRDRHLDYFVDLSESLSPQLLGPEQTAAAFLLSKDQENLLTALSWCSKDPAMVGLGLRMLSAIQYYWVLLGRLQLGCMLLEEFLARPEASVAGPDRTRALLAAAYLRYFTGDYAQVQEHASAGLRASREEGNLAATAFGLSILGGAALGSGDSVAARRYMEEAADVAKLSEDEVQLSYAFSALGELERLEGNLDAAEPLYRETVAIARRRTDPANTATNTLNLARLSITNGALDEAVEHLQEGLDIGLEIEASNVMQAILQVATGFFAAIGSPEQAARFFGAHEIYTENTGYSIEPADEAFIAPLIASAQRSMGDAAFEECAAGGRKLSAPEALAELQGWLAYNRGAGEIDHMPSSQMGA